MNHKTNKRDILIVLPVFSLASILLTPVSEVKKGITDNLPWIGVGTLITEVFFIIGLGIMALEAGHQLGPNPVRWRRKLPHIFRGVVRTKIFWLGFYTNTAGALGTAIILSIGIFKILPPQSWGLIILPLLDLSLTFALRYAVVNASKDER